VGEGENKHKFLKEKTEIQLLRYKGMKKLNGLEKAAV
jgi:hypothetical protein